MQNKQTARDQLDDESPSRVKQLEAMGQQQPEQPQDIRTNSATVLNQSAQPHQDTQLDRCIQDQNNTENNRTHHPNSLFNIDLTQNQNQDLSMEATQPLADGCQAIQTAQQLNQANWEQADCQNDQKTQNQRRDQRASGNAMEQSVTELEAPNKQETIQLTSQIDQSIQNLGQEAKQVDKQSFDTISEEQPSRSSQNVSDKNSKISHYMSMTQTQNGNRLNCTSAEQQTCNNQHKNPMEQTYVASQQPEQLVNKQLELLTQLLQGQQGLGQLTQQLQPAGGISQNHTQTVTQIQNQAKLLSSVDQNVVQNMQSQAIPTLNSGNAYQTGINSLSLQEQSTNLLNKQTQNEQSRLSNLEVKSSALQGTNDVDSGLNNPGSLTKTECLKQTDNTMQSEQLYNLKSNSLQDNSHKFESVNKERRASIQGIDDMQKLFQLWQTDHNAKAQGKTIKSETMSTLLTSLMSKQDAQQTDNSGGSLADTKQTGFKEISAAINSNATNQSNISTRVMNQRTISNISSQHPISEQEHQCLLAQLRNQSNEIHQLKAFIIMHMLFGQSNHGDSQSNFIASIMQNFMVQMLMQNSNKQFGEVAPIHQSQFDSARPPINNDSSTQLESQNTINQMMQITKLMQQIDQIESITRQRPAINRLNPPPQQPSAVESILGKRTIHQMKESNPINQDYEPLLDQCAQKHRKLQQAQHQDCNYIQMPSNQKEQSIGTTCKFENASTLNQKKPANKHQFSVKEIQGALAGKFKNKSEVAASNQQEVPAESEKSSQDDRIELQNIDQLPDQTAVDRTSDLCSALQNGFSQSVDHQYEGTSAFLRLKAQIKKNMLYEQFLQMKNEILGVVQVSQPNQILINDKPKRLHHNMGDNSFRGSKFRGVSKNKCKWQMMIMINQKKVYIGAIHTELEAAKYYDHIAILTQGLHAKTNFAYNASQLESIVNDYDFTVEQDGQALKHFQSKFSSNQNHTLNTSNLQQEQISNESLQKDNLNQKGQLKEYGTLQQNCSDVNLKIGKHDFKTKQHPFDQTVSESINESISYGGNRKINEDTELDGQLHQKIEQLGFNSLQHLLNFVQANNITNQATQDNKATLRNQEFNSIAMPSNGLLNSETNKDQKQPQVLNQPFKSQSRPSQKQSDNFQPQTGLNLQQLLFKNQNMMNNGALLNKQIQSINQQVLKSCTDQQNNNDANQHTEKVKAQDTNEELMKPRVSPHLKVHLEKSLQQTNSLNKQQINNQLLGQRLHIQQQAIQNSSQLLGGLGGSHSNQTSCLNLDQLKMLQQQASQKTNNFQAAVPLNGLQNQFSRTNVGMDQITGAQINQTNEQHSRLENCLSTNQQSLPAKAKQNQVVGLGSKQQLMEQQAIQMLKNLKQKQDTVSSTMADLPRASEVLRATLRKQSGIGLPSVKLPQDHIKTHPSYNDQFTKK